MSIESSKSFLGGPTRLLAAVAALMLQVVIHDRLVDPYVEWIHLLVAMGLALVIRRTERMENERLRGKLSAACFVVLLVIPFLGNVVMRNFSAWGSPLEIQAVLGLRNMMFGLAAVRNDRSLRFGALASCFTALYSILWLMNGWNIALMCAYSVVGMWWLAGAYWSGISDCFLHRSDRSVPWKPICGTACAGLLTLIVLTSIATGTSFTTAINGLIPSSGGTKWGDEHAFGGVGDGPQLVSAQEDASSFGPLESQLFLESEMPSLYDCFNEFSDPPETKLKKRKRIRAIPLSPSRMKENHERRGVNQKPSREFNAVRRRKRKQPVPKVGDQRSPELFQLVGRVPLHLGLYAYDLWDGHELRSSNIAKEMTFYLDRRPNGKNWVWFDGRKRDAVLTHLEKHQVRIINLKTDRLPSPPNIRGAHLDQIHAANFFDTTQDGMVAMDVPYIPQLSVIHVQSFQRRRIDEPFPVQSEVSVDRTSPIATLASEWTDGVPAGWPQIKAICRRLRADYELDPHAVAPPEVDDVAALFLQDTRCGPDYLFATSAAMLLRSLGYETRVISGFYADPANYNGKARVTSVYAEDAHFWVEVLAKSVDPSHPTYDELANRWIAIDPSPGYEVLLAPESFWSMLFTHATLTWRAVKNHPYPSIAFCILSLWAWVMRARLCDIGVTSWWRLRFPFASVRDQVILTLRLLDRRARIYGQPREPALSLRRWGLLTNALTDRSRTPFLAIADWALYDELPPSQPECEISGLCMSAIALFRPSGDGRKRSLRAEEARV